MELESDYCRIEIFPPWGRREKENELESDYCRIEIWYDDLIGGVGDR